MKPKELIGWIGVLLILLAYSMVMLEIIAPENILYGLINFVGALGIIVSSYYKRDFQPVLLNIAWLIVAGIGIIKSFV
jgi:paired small multidrug resistance pump